jgi:O-antigen ligase
MKQIFIINDKTENKISFYHLACFLVVLPYDLFYSEIILISFGLHTLIHAKRENLENIFSKSVLVPTSLYLLGLVSMLYSADIPEALNLATRQLAILLFPVLFAISNLDLKKYTMNLVYIFGFSCTITILYLYFDAIHTILYFKLPLASLFRLIFMNHNFSIPIGIHATYLSVYTAFALISFLYLLVSQKQLKHKWIYVVAAAILFGGLLQLSSRSVFIAFLIVMNLVFPLLVFNGKKRLQAFLATSLISVGLLVLIYSVDSFKTRYISDLKVDLTDHVKIIENIEPRVARWDVMFELIKRSPVIGYGSGSETRLLKEKYFEKGLYNSYLNEFNAHNEYLSILIKTGIIGLLLFLYILYFGFASAIRRRDVLFLSFMVIIAVVSLSENILELNKGIFFYAFFFSLFLWKKNRAKGENSMEAGGEPGNPGSLNLV